LEVVVLPAVLMEVEDVEDMGLLILQPFLVALTQRTLAITEEEALDYTIRIMEGRVVVI
jgi:hypothetical protein